MIPVSSIIDYLGQQYKVAGVMSLALEGHYFLTANNLVAMVSADILEPLLTES